MDLIIRNLDNEILPGLRKLEPAKGFWFVPCGRIHKGELVRKAFSDIFQNKLGITADYADTALLGVYEHFYDTNPHGLQNCSIHLLSIVHEINVNNIQLDQFPTDQHEAWRWFTFSELMSSTDAHKNTKNIVSSS